MKRTLTAVLALIALAAPAALANAEVNTLDGNWKLDWDRSEPFDRVLEALEVGWLMRRLAGVASVEMGLRSMAPTCDACADRVEIRFASPISERTQIVVLDGEQRPGEDPQGNPTVDSYRWNAEVGLEMTRERKLPSGKSARIIDSRRIGDDRDTLLSQLTIWVEGEERASVSRMFKRSAE